MLTQREFVSWYRAKLRSAKWVPIGAPPAPLPNPATARDQEHEHLARLREMLAVAANTIREMAVSPETRERLLKENTAVRARVDARLANLG